MSDESIISPSKPNNILAPLISYVDFTTTRKRIKFNGSCLRQDETAFAHGTIVNIHIAYEITKNNSISSYPMVENCLLGAIKLTKNPDIDKYEYSGYGIGFDRKENFSTGDESGQNVIIFGAAMNSSVHANNKTKNIKQKQIRIKSFWKFCDTK